MIKKCGVKPQICQDVVSIEHDTLSALLQSTKLNNEFQMGANSCVVFL